MDRILAVDRGNTAVKVGVYEGETLIEALTADAFGEQLAHALKRRYGSFAAAIVARVGAQHPGEAQALAALAQRILAVPGDLRLPISLSYSATLGADRIAAAVGARALLPGRDILVVDAGTAVTFDAVGADGSFRGGNIAPGVLTGLRALHGHTAALPLLEPPLGIPEPGSLFGHDTPAAMLNGVVYGIVGAIRLYLTALAPDAATVLTGGAAPLLLSTGLLPQSTVVEPHLVLNGLNCILRYNEDI